jgi:hypothetical protein
MDEYVCLNEDVNIEEQDWLNYVKQKLSYEEQYKIANNINPFELLKDTYKGTSESAMVKKITKLIPDNIIKINDIESLDLIKDINLDYEGSDYYNTCGAELWQTCGASETCSGGACVPDSSDGCTGDYASPDFCLSDPVLGSDITSTTWGHNKCAADCGAGYQWIDFHVEGGWSATGCAQGSGWSNDSCACGIGWAYIRDQNAECYEGSTGLTTASSLVQGTQGYKLFFGGSCDPYNGDCGCTNTMPLVCVN